MDMYMRTYITGATYSNRFNDYKASIVGKEKNPYLDFKQFLINEINTIEQSIAETKIGAMWNRDGRPCYWNGDDSKMSNFDYFAQQWYSSDYEYFLNDVAKLNWLHCKYNGVADIDVSYCMDIIADLHDVDEIVNKIANHVRNVCMGNNNPSILIDGYIYGIRWSKEPELPNMEDLMSKNEEMTFGCSYTSGTECEIRELQHRETLKKHRCEYNKKVSKVVDVLKKLKEDFQSNTINSPFDTKVVQNSVINMDICQQEEITKVGKSSYNLTDKTQQASTQREKRKVDIDRLFRCLKSDYRGTKEAPSIPFNLLIKTLEQNLSIKEFGNIAYMIYYSDYMIKTTKPNTFSKWYNEFCEIVECKKGAYRPAHLKPSKEIKERYLALGL